MFVGTNNAVRIAALKSIGGLQDSVTEDMATSLVLHTARNPETGCNWSSVYTPDVVAVGEGPESFTDYFVQQARWSGGTNQLLVSRFWRSAPRLDRHRLLHYSLLTSYYPTAAISWVLGAVNGIVYFALGAGGSIVNGRTWLMFYVNAVALQLALYIYNRRHNVSPRELEGTPGVLGMMMSALSAPIYVSSLFGAAIGRNTTFKVTPKGGAAHRDSLGTFRLHLVWAVVFAIPLVLSFPLHNDRLAMRLWSLASLAVCLLPVAIWCVGRLRDHRSSRATARSTLRQSNAKRQVESALAMETQ
jgi:hypothetical protein